jgi:hypothetical protein
MAKVVQTNQLPPITDLTGAYVIGLTAAGTDAKFPLAQLVRNSLGQFKTTDPTPSTPLLNQNYELVGAAVGLTSSGTYTNLKGLGGASIVIPAAAAAHAIINARAIWNGSYWVPVWQDILIPSSDISGKEDSTNKVTSFLVIDNITYPTTAATAAAINAVFSAKNVRQGTNGNMNFVDDNGNIGMMLTAAGTLVVKSISGLSSLVGLGAVGATLVNNMVINTPSTGFAFDLTDATGNLIFGVKLDGTLVQKITETSYIADMVLVPTYGQSLSIGINGNPVMTTATEPHIYTFNGGPLVTDASADYTSLKLSVQVTRETPSDALCRMARQAMYDSGLFASGTDYLYDFILFNPGQGGIPIETLRKGGAPYNRLLLGINAGKTLANAMGNTFNFPAFFWVQGEANIDLGSTRPSYKAQMVLLLNEINTDAKAVTGQTNNVKMLTYQTASMNAYTSSPDVPLAQLESSLEGKNIHMVVVMYPYDYSASDNVHMLNGEQYQRVGALAGYIYKKILVDGVDWKPIHIKSTVFVGSTIDVKFHVPVKPLVFDTTIVTNPGNYGFRLFNGTTEIAITAVSIIRPDTVRIVASSPVAAGYTLTYAINGTTGLTGRTGGPRGNLRDSQGETIIYKPATLNYRLYNWTPISKINL